MNHFPYLRVASMLACICLFAAGCGEPAPKQTQPLTENDNPDIAPTESVDRVPDESDKPDVSEPPLTPPADRALPGVGGTNSGAADDGTEFEDVPSWERQGPLPEEVARNAFRPPPGAKSLSKDGRLWVDLKQNRVFVDGYVALKRGPLEMFACPVGTKEHESIVAALARSREVHAALLAVDATPGTPVRFRPEFLPPTGQVIRVWVCWYDKDNKFQVCDAREWIEDLQTEKAMAVEWVFAGSGFFKQPDDNREYYEADSGDMICVSNFSSAMLDVSIPSSADAGSLRFVPFEAKIPDRDTPVRLVLAPVPSPTDDPNENDNGNELKLPTADDVPRAP